MTPAEVDFLRRLAAEKPVWRRNDGVAARMGALHGLGSVRGSRVFYVERDHGIAADMLSNRGFELTAREGVYTRDAAPVGFSEKYGALPVMHEMVAIVPIGIHTDVVAPINGFVSMAWREAIQLPYEVLLVSENLQPLFLVHHFRWLGQFIKNRPTLALFRGTVEIFGTESPAKLIAADDRPTLAFFDFDPKGLSMAASLPRREALCMPPWPALEAMTRQERRENLYLQSVHTSRAHLDKVDDSEIATAWLRLKGLTMGLNQESFPR